ncbi:hypothetical protein TYRP_016687 [Tyrophagus putrescentiae]|nr:hypothetical protein TYRP_016687 [Tyrophagus putrescentiae]
MLKTTAAHQFCRINSAITVSHQTEKTKTVQLATAYASVALVRAFEVQNLQRCLPVFFTVFDCAKQRCVLVEALNGQPLLPPPASNDSSNAARSISEVKLADWQRQQQQRHWAMLATPQRPAILSTAPFAAARINPLRFSIENAGCKNG